LRDRIRQVEVPGEISAAELDKVASVLGCVQFGTTTVAWVKPHGLCDEDICSRLGQHATIRGVGLESLYLAIAEHRVQIDAQTEREALA